MLNKTIYLLIPALLFALLEFGSACAFEYRNRYATLRYADKELLTAFNDELDMGRSLAGHIQKRHPATTEEEAMAKIDTILLKAQIVLDMYPDDMHITVVLLPDKREVSRLYGQKYLPSLSHPSADHIAYYSLREKTIYISVDDTSLKVLSHEIGHAVVDHYFQVRPPYAVHELMAQYTALHIED